MTVVRSSLAGRADLGTNAPWRWMAELGGRGSWGRMVRKVVLLFVFVAVMVLVVDGYSISSSSSAMRVMIDDVVLQSYSMLCAI